ncbi:nucleotidyltransferase [Pontibacter ruber]|uniref:Nucleotidyltransferase n=1 Tax=Pontibacter ruber TaxID=1343895 RepID=A0ABW5D122_9BACT|nr:nucleotidyltransferase [Pontibacter ruber]
MATLLQCIKKFIDKISVTDRQEESINGSISNIKDHLLDDDNDLSVERIFTNGSYERDTILRPLDDIDIFAVLKREDYTNEYGQLCSPQSVLTKLKNYLNSSADYAGKVKQDRPCVTISLSDKNFDILPSFEEETGGYLIPNYDLKSWTYSYPVKLTKDLADVHRIRNYSVKQVVKVAKYRNRDLDKLMPSYHIEEVAIRIFTVNAFANYEEGIRLWFNQAEYYAEQGKFTSYKAYEQAIILIKEAKIKLNEAHEYKKSGNEAEAIKIWKGLFGRDFPTVDTEEAKNYSRALSEGTLKVASTGAISTSSGKSVLASKGYFGDVSQ